MLKRLSALSLPLLISFWGGCFEETFDLTEAADLTDPQEYHSNQIFFKYPKNWEISADSNTSAFHNIYMQTQSEAMVIYQSYPSNVAESLTTFSKDFSEKKGRAETFFEGENIKIAEACADTLREELFAGSNFR